MTSNKVEKLYNNATHNKMITIPLTFFGYRDPETNKVHTFARHQYTIPGGFPTIDNPEGLTGPFKMVKWFEVNLLEPQELMEKVD